MKMRRSLCIIPFLFIAIVISAPNAHADQFDFTLSGPVTGFGTFTTDPLSNGSYLVTGITGTYGVPGNSEQSTITSLFGVGCNQSTAGSPIGGCADTWGGGPPGDPHCGGACPNDNLLFPTAPFLDIFGIAFATSDGTDVNLSIPTGGQYAGQGTYEVYAVGPGNILTTGETFTYAVTPEPGTAILWLTGIVLMIVTRKRLAQILRQLG